MTDHFRCQIVLFYPLRRYGQYQLDRLLQCGFVGAIVLDLTVHDFVTRLCYTL